MAAVVKKWLAKGIPLWYTIQRPGAVVYSPSSVRGAGHMVLTIGPNLMQSAFNMGQSIDAFRSCLRTSAVAVGAIGVVITCDSRESTVPWCR
jgi:hypothetical protein